MDQGMKENSLYVEHNFYLDKLKLSILKGAPYYVIEQQVQKVGALKQLSRHVIPAKTLATIGKVELSEVNTRFEEYRLWAESLEGHDDSKEALAKLETARLVTDGLLSGKLGTEHAEWLIAQANEAHSKETKPLHLTKACQLDQDGVITPQMPFAVTYETYARMQEVENKQREGIVPIKSNDLRHKLTTNFAEALDNGVLTMHQQMGLYRILGPERIEPKGIEVNTTNNNTSNQIIVNMDAAKLAPKNLVVSDNGELLGVGNDYGTMNKEGVLKLAATGQIDEADSSATDGLQFLDKMGITK